MLVLVSIAGYSQSPTKGALNTIDTINKPTIKMVAVNKLDNLVYYWDLQYWRLVSTSGSSGDYANKLLSNLTSPTAINQHLLPSTTNSIDFGSTGKTFRNGYFGAYPSTATSGVIYFGTIRMMQAFSAAGTTGDNFFAGPNAGNLSLTGSSSGIQGSNNTAVGPASMISLTTGSRNTAVGTYSMQSNTTGLNNTVMGQNALYSNTTGYNNAVVGVRAAAFGDNHDVAALGVDAASRGNAMEHVVAIGTDAFYNGWNTKYSVAIGDSAAWVDSTSYKDVFIGSRAGYYLGGDYASRHDDRVTFIGAEASRSNTVSGDVAISNSTAIGYNSKVYASNQVVIGDTNVTSMLLRGSVGIGTGVSSANAASILDLTSTSKGLLLPRMTKAQRDAISSPVAGLVIFQTDNTPGLRTYNGTNWVRYTETID